MYARSVYGFENALNLWDQNYDAQLGLMNARLDYANAALKKENFDLGLSLVNYNHPSYKSTYKKLLAGQGGRKSMDARFRTMRTAAAALLAMLFIGGSVSGLIMNSLQATAVAKALEAKDAVVGGSNAPSGQMNRDAAFAQLKQLASFFRRTEPHSPISHAIEQAVLLESPSLPDL